jgi:hypothetical protein
MRNSHSFSMWVKNVYNLCVQYSITCVRSYTGIQSFVYTPLVRRVKTPTYTRFTLPFPPALYTAFLTPFNLVHIHLYTLSTAPIISKTN